MIKEFVLTQPYATLVEMINSEEVATFKKELQKGEIEFYAIVSRIGNKYDIFGNKITDIVQNPFLLCQAPVKQQVIVEEAQNVSVERPVVTEIEEKKEEETDMKYTEIEALIDNEIAKAVDEIKKAHEDEIAKIKEECAIAVANAKAEAKAELIAKLNA